eukprot:SAG31_NODE_22369_length_527_cov_0.901869_1_plen_43_part_01
MGGGGENAKDENRRFQTNAAHALHPEQWSIRIDVGSYSCRSVC